MLHLQLVLSAYVAPSELQTALNEYATIAYHQQSSQAPPAGAAANNVVVAVQVVGTAPVPDGVAYEIKVRIVLVGAAATINEEKEDDSAAEMWLSSSSSLDAFLRDYFASSSAAAVHLVRVSPVAASAAANDDDDVEDDQTTPHVSGWIAIGSVAAALFCCGAGLSILILPGYLKFRRELREEWTYNPAKEKSLMHTSTWAETEDTEDEDKQEEEESVAAAPPIAPPLPRLDEESN